MEEQHKQDINKDTVPIVNQLQEIYVDVNGSIKKIHERRYNNLRDRFKALYGEIPTFFSRAPGRVNIIGEHIDYCGYAVLPAAIEQDFVMAYTINESDKIEIANIDKDQFPQEKLTNDPFQKFKEDKTHWLNYFLCGYKAILAIDETLITQAKTKGQPKGLKIMVDSHVPMSAGLSSSSAFTVCTALLTLHANALITNLNKAQLSNLCVQAERMAGTACGGMDQTISIMGEMSKAKLIEFNPVLKATDVKIPESVSLVIANSLAPSPKLVTLYKRYNMRVVECRLALVFLAIKSGQSPNPQEVQFKTFYELQTSLGYSFEQMIDLTKESLTKGGYTQEKIRKELNLLNTSEINGLVKDIAYSYEVLSNNAAFYLLERALHVFSESKRVFDYKQTCDDEQLIQNQDAQVAKLGQLMNESHKSCHELYDCSSPELEELTNLCRSSGALGSRLTGAGWGGCCVSLIRKDDKDKFINDVQEYYLKKRDPSEQLWITDDLDRYLFATQPGRGACILDPQYAIWM